MRKLSLLTFIIFLNFGCLVDKSKLGVSFQNKTKKNNVVGNVTQANISSVQIINNQLVITGNGLTHVLNVKVDGTAFTENFTIESKSATQIIANSIRAFSFDVSKVFNVILSDANASVTFPIDFSLCNATLNGRGFDCTAPIADKDVLSYDAISGKWKPRAVSGLNYLGAFNASSNPATGPATQPAGAYYIISASGAIAGIPFTIGDWLVSNGSAWQKIDNSTAVLSVFGRNGAVTAQTGDYSLDMLGDISFPTAPVAGKVLKFDGTNWVAGDDLSGGGAGSVSTAELADGSVTDAKIVTVATSKLTGTISSSQITDGTIPYVKLSIADGDIPAAKISGLPVLSSILAATITNDDTTHAPTGEAVYEALQTKIGTNGGTLSVGTISGVPTPVNPSDVVNKAYVDTLATLFVTDDIAEGVNLYFTEARVLGTDLAGLNTGVNGPITAADTVLSAFGKMQYQVTDLKAKGQWDKTVNDISYSAGNVSIDKKLRLKSDNANYVEMLSPNALASTYTLTLPGNDGNANQVLKTDGSGVLAWVDLTDTSVQAFAKSALPTCAAGEVLKSNGTTFSCITDNTGAGAFSGTANSAVITTAGGALGVSATTSTELGYVSGVTSAIQAQIDGKQAALGFTPINKAGDTIASGTFVFGGTSALRAADPIAATDVVNKQYFETFGQWSKNGSDIYRSSGNVGIGTTTPTAPLEVNAGATAFGTTQLKVTDGVTGGYWAVSEGTSAVNAYMPTFTLSGIGLNGYGGTFLGQMPPANDVNNVNGAAIVLDGRTTSGALTNANILNIRNNGTPHMVVSSVGHVGIGTSSPTSNLHITAPANSNTFKITTGTNELLIGEDVELPGMTRIRPTAGSGVVITGNNDVPGIFVNAANSNVAIGSTAPATKLDVNGSIRVGVDATACSGAIAGAMRFNTPNVEYCNGTTWAAFNSGTAAVASSQITDGTIVNADINAAANITATKLGTGAVDNTEFNYLDGVTSSIQTQLSGKQAADTTLTALAGYNTNGILVQTTADTFVGRSIAGTANRLTVTNGDGIAGNPTLNIPTALLPSPVVGDVGKFLKATAADTSVWTAFGSSDVTTALGFTPINKAGDSISTGTFTLSGTAVMRTPDPIGLTDIANRQWVENYITSTIGTNGQWTKGVGGNIADIYFNTGNVGIGTTTPFYKLDLTGNMRVLNGAVSFENNAASSSASSLSFWKSRNYAANVTNDEVGYFSFYGHDGTGLYRSAFIAGYVDGTPASGPHSVPGRLSFHTTVAGSTDSTERMRIDSAGNIGMGTTVPLGKLDIAWGGASGLTGGADMSAATRTNNTAKWFRYSQTQYANANAPFMAIMTGSTATENAVYLGGGSALQPTATALRFYTGTSQSVNGSAVERMTINSAGNIGIGTNNPGAKLAVEGTGAVGFQMKTTGAVAVDTMNFINDMDASGNFWFAKGSTSTAAPAVADKLMNITNEGNLEVYGQQVNGTTDASGVLGLKTQASGSGGTKNEVSLEFYADRTNLNTMSGFVGYESGTAFDMSMKNTKAGSLILGTNNTDNITILSDGKVGIGMSSPQHTLDVNGNVGTGPRITSSVDGANNAFWLAKGSSAEANRIGYGINADPSTGVVSSVVLKTNGASRLHIDNNGNVGIGTIVPAARLEVVSSTTLASNGSGPNVYLRNTQSANSDYLALGWLGEDTWGVFSADSATHRNFAIQPFGGAVGIGTTTPSYTLHVNGSVAGTGAYNSLSDARLKKDIEVIPNSLEKISALRGVSFNWDKEAHPELKLGDRGELGVIAQEVRKVFPDAVTVDKKTGILSVAYSMLIAPLIEAVKDLFNDSKELKREIASLKKDNELKAQQIKKNAEENQELKKRLDKIEKLLNKSK